MRRSRAGHCHGRRQITLGILAGGRATRLGGSTRPGSSATACRRCMRWQRRFAPRSRRRAGQRQPRSRTLRAAGLDRGRRSHRRRPRPDRPASTRSRSACATPWLLTLPVDLVGVNDCLLPTLVARAGANGAFAEDDDGPQPLVALWRVAALARASPRQRCRDRRVAVHALQARSTCRASASTAYASATSTRPRTSPRPVSRHCLRHDRTSRLDCCSTTRWPSSREVAAQHRLETESLALVAHARPRAGAGRRRADRRCRRSTTARWTASPCATPICARRRDRAAPGGRTVRRPRARPAASARANACASPPARRCRRAPTRW